MPIKESKTTIRYNDRYNGKVKRYAKLIRLLLHTTKYKYLYLLTINKHQVKDYVTRESLGYIMLRLKMLISDLYMPHMAFEIGDKYKQLHMHGLGVTTKPVLYSKHNSILGFRIEWKRVYNLKGVLQYIYKSAYNKYEQENIIDNNYYNHNFGFIDK